MRKYLIGTIFGFVLATAVSANAQEVNRLIDSVVQGIFPVTVEGTSVGDAIVVNDKTYLPVREFGEAVGYKVTFTEEREVVLTKNADNSVPTEGKPEPSQKSITDQIKDLQNKIIADKSNLESYKLFKSQNEKLMEIPSFNKEEMQKIIDAYSKDILDAESRISSYEAQITALEAQQ